MIHLSVLWCCCFLQHASIIAFALHCLEFSCFHFEEQLQKKNGQKWRRQKKRNEKQTYFHFSCSICFIPLWFFSFFWCVPCWSLLSMSGWVRAYVCVSVCWHRDDNMHSSTFRESIFLQWFRMPKEMHKIAKYLCGSHSAGVEDKWIVSNSNSIDSALLLIVLFTCTRGEDKKAGTSWFLSLAYFVCCSLRFEFT